MAKKFLNILTSLHLTVVCLSLATLLVFVGTLAQVDEGLYNAQHRYFRSLLIWWSLPGASWKLPVFPGGYLIGGVLLVNLVAAHLKRFSFSRKKIGIFIIHAGLILLLLGQLLTDFLSVESSMRLTEGEAKDYSLSQQASELALIEVSNPEYNEVVAIPDKILARQKEITNRKLPFTVRIKNYYPNSALTNRLSNAGGETLPATRGVGTQLKLIPLQPTVRMDERNLPSALVELVTAQGASLGTWLVSAWLDAPQTFTHESKSYQMALRFTRFYKPFSIQLVDFRHDKYKGTEIPKNFSSRIRVQRPATGEDREVLIYMNNPLRYWGETYYQASYDENDPRVSILQVVRNPSWLTPYLSCCLVGLGLAVQFMSHLISFAKRRAA
ncbi:MAG: cytochrome c biogenesis protein ResB [Verrucomicrobiota bacterium]